MHWKVKYFVLKVNFLSQGRKLDIVSTLETKSVLRRWYIFAKYRSHTTNDFLPTQKIRDRMGSKYIERERFFGFYFANRDEKRCEKSTICENNIINSHEPSDSILIDQLFKRTSFLLASPFRLL